MDSSSALPGACRLRALNARSDPRGSLVAIEEAEIGFNLSRVYYIYGAAGGVERGFHAHRQIEQLATVVRGACTVDLDDGRTRASVRLADPVTGLTLPPMVWHVMREFTSDCVLLVLASAPYDEADYIRSYEEFLALAGAAARP